MIAIWILIILSKTAIETKQGQGNMRVTVRACMSREVNLIKPFGQIKMAAKIVFPLPSWSGWLDFADFWYIYRYSVINIYTKEKPPKRSLPVGPILLVNDISLEIYKKNLFCTKCCRKN